MGKLKKDLLKARKLIADDKDTAVNEVKEDGLKDEEEKSEIEDEDGHEDVFAEEVVVENEPMEEEMVKEGTQVKEKMAEMQNENCFEDIAVNVMKDEGPLRERE